MEITMRQIGIEALLIMDKVGIPLLYQKLNPKRADIQPVLLSGFLTAIKEFSTAIIEGAIKDFHVDYGERTISIISGKKVIFAAIHDRENHEKIVPIIIPLLQEFEKYYYQDVEIGEPGDLNQYLPFKERIANVMGITNPSLEWIPILNQEAPGKKSAKPKIKLPLQFIDGTNSIQEIVTKSNLKQAVVLEDISKLWAYNKIRFRNILTEKDIVIPNRKMNQYLQPSSEEWQALKHEFPKLVSTIPYIASHLDGKTTIGHIIDEFCEEGPEKMYWLMDFLFLNDALELLTPEKRRVLMVKEIIDRAIMVAADVYSLEDSLATIQEAIKQVNKPEIITQIQVLKDNWKIDYSILLYEGLTPEKVMSLYQDWLSILRIFIYKISEKKRKKFLEELTRELDYEFFEKYKSEDLDGLEEFAVWLESMFS
jgi:hypothetical protein